MTKKEVVKALLAQQANLHNLLGEMETYARTTAFTDSRCEVIQELLTAVGESLVVMAYLNRQLKN